MVLGPTAVGKTKVAIKLAQRLNGEIVSCDSMQLYKYMDIGSAKPTEEERRMAVHHLIDAIDPREEFSVARYQKIAKEHIFTIINNSKLPVVAGGTGLYANSLIYDMDFSEAPKDPEFRSYLEVILKLKGKEFLHKMLREKDEEAALRINESNSKKVIRALEILNSGGSLKEFNESFKKTKDYEVLLLGLTRDRSELYDRINNRVDMIIKKGLVDEVKRLLDIGVMDSDIAMRAIGYKELIPFINGEDSLENAVELIKKNTRHYAKRQMTWFKRYEEIKWFNLSDYTHEDSALEDMISWYLKTSK